MSAEVNVTVEEAVATSVEVQEPAPIVVTTEQSGPLNVVVEYLDQDPINVVVEPIVTEVVLEQPIDPTVVVVETPPQPTVIHVDYAPGPEGPPGPPGGDKYFEHQQDTPAAVWLYEHDFGRKPNVRTFGTDGVEYDGDVTYPDATHVRIEFSGSMSGIAINT